MQTDKNVKMLILRSRVSRAYMYFHENPLLLLFSLFQLLRNGNEISLSF